jgi:dihydrofolate synthase/folylpolyglutamate synthase
VAAERAAGIVQAPAEPGVPVAALGSFQRRNFALARTAAEAYLGELDAGAVADAAATTRAPGRLEIVGEQPLTLLDGAHNPEGMAALIESLSEPFAARRAPLVAVVSILEDKDAAGMLRALLGASDALICTSSHNPRALPPGTLQSLASQLNGPPAEIVAEPRAALARARELAGPQGIVLATGSIYLVGDLISGERRERASNL